jgi:hypothetical protein
MDLMAKKVIMKTTSHKLRLTNPWRKEVEQLIKFKTLNEDFSIDQINLTDLFIPLVLLLQFCKPYADNT